MRGLHLCWTFIALCFYFPNHLFTLSYWVKYLDSCANCDVVCYRERVKWRSIHYPSQALNQQELRKTGSQGPTVKVVGERNGKLTISLALKPVEATDDRSQGQLSGVIWRGGGRRKDDWLVDRIFVPKGRHALEKFERESFVSGGTALKAVAVLMSSGRKKRITHKKNKVWGLKSVKDKYSSNSFLLPNLKYWKVVCILKTVNVLFHQLSKILYKHFYTHLRYFIQVKEREKKRKKKKNYWETFLFNAFLLTKYFRCLKREEKKNCFLNFLICFNRHISKFCYILNAPLCWNALIVFSSSCWIDFYMYFISWSHSAFINSR